MGKSEIRCDLAVVGAGLSGLTAALFAAERGLSVVLLGTAGASRLGTGMIDLMGPHPADSGTGRDSPWKALASIRSDHPKHPLARIDEHTIREAINRVIGFLATTGLKYVTGGENNLTMLTAVGRLKTTYAVPESMWPCIGHLERKQPAVVIDLDGLKGFSARQISETVRSEWPGMTFATVAYPGYTGELYGESLARDLDHPDARRQLAQIIAPHLKNARVVGLPGILGYSRPSAAQAHLQELLGIPVFEIPTLPPSVTGLRLLQAFEAGLTDRHVNLLCPQRVLKADSITHDGLRLQVGTRQPEFTVDARNVLLASGRFFGRGLTAARSRVRETVFDLPVAQPDRRDDWHRHHLFDRRGHAINRAGIEIDDRFRPLGRDGRPVSESLFAAGSILAHHDWMRQKCGGGLAVATALAAVNACVASRK